MKKLLLVLLFAGIPMFVSADATSTATVTIRAGDITAFTGVVELAASTTPPVDIAPTNSTTTVPVAADSLLATLVALDAITTHFDITDLAYFSSFNSFIINCIGIAAASSTDCYNWTYAVNETFPQVGADHTILHDGDIVHLFFGPPRQAVVSTSTVFVGEPFTARAEHYDLASGTYLPSPGLTLGVGTPNLDFSFTELATSTSGANGEAIFSLNATGTFSVGIQEDFYFPAASISVVEPAPTPPVDNPPPTGGGGGVVHIQLNIQNALAYLASKQHPDGSFGAPLYSDWATLAFAASDPGAAKTNLRNYLLAASPVLSSVTDYERHAMALMALGINPYSETSVNYIAPIVHAFDGTQMGDAGLVNDDIFALFPLLRAGYSTSDDIIQKTVAFILSRQQASGAWDGSVDMTAAAVQALSLVASLPNVGAALTKAEQYLRSGQQANGGWGNSFSTSWALQAIAALGQSPSNWAPSGYNPNDYLASQQQSDGGVEPTSSSDNTRVWATAYAIPGASGKTWSSLLSSFPKPTASTSGTGTVAGAATSTLPAATSTASVATSTPPIATSTLPATTSTPSIVATATPTSTPQILDQKPKKVVYNKIVPPTPQPIISSTDAAPEVETRNPSLFNVLWGAIVSFFSKLF